MRETHVVACKRCLPTQPLLCPAAEAVCSCMQSAQAEIALWFSPEELAEYSRSLDAWIYE